MADTSNSFTWVFGGSIVAYFSITVRKRAVVGFQMMALTNESIERNAHTTK